MTIKEHKNLPAGWKHGKFYIATVEAGVGYYLHKDLTVTEGINSFDNGYYHTREEAQATIDRYKELHK